MKNCEETNSRGFDRTGLARLDESRKKERRKRRRKSGESGFLTDNETAFRQGFRAL